MSDNKTLEQAIAELDVKNDDHWTADGWPRMDVLHELMGSDELTRKQLTDLAPNLTRQNFAQDLDNAKPPEPEGRTTQGTDSDDSPPEEQAAVPQPAPPSPQEEPEDLTPAIEELDASIDEVEAKLAEADEMAGEIQSERDKLKAQRDKLIEKRDGVVDPQQGMKDRLAFIKSQTANRAAKAGDARAAAELLRQARGISGSPLDQALSNRPRQTRVAPPEKA